MAPGKRGRLIVTSLERAIEGPSLHEAMTSVPNSMG